MFDAFDESRVHVQLLNININSLQRSLVKSHWDLIGWQPRSFLTTSLMYRIDYKHILDHLKFSLTISIVTKDLTKIDRLESRVLLDSNKNLSKIIFCESNSREI